MEQTANLHSPSSQGRAALLGQRKLSPWKRGRPEDQAHRPWTVWTAHSEMSPGQCRITQQSLIAALEAEWLYQCLDIWPQWPLLDQSILPSVSGNASDSFPIFSLAELVILCS